MQPVLTQDSSLYYGIDVLEGLKLLSDKSVHMIATSPPYWALRNYGVEGQIGCEATPEEYVSKLVAVFKEARRVLRDDGTLWVNLGDSSMSHTAKQANNMGGFTGGRIRGNSGLEKSLVIGKPKKVPGLKNKDLVGIPWRVALALQADGWYLRNAIVWEKPNARPLSVSDRLTPRYEFIFLLSKKETYFFDLAAIKVPTVGEDDLKNPGDVWRISTVPYKEAHFAVWPPELARRMILAGSSSQGCCPHCGAPWERFRGRKRKSSDWEPTCTCSNNDGSGKSVVLDPFSGSGTTGEVSIQLGRKYIGIDINPDFLQLACKRLSEFSVPVPLSEAQDLITELFS
jgi:DNA modification methylase